jgi:hypothetical protein
MLGLAIYHSGVPQKPVPQPPPTPTPVALPLGPCAWEEERDMKLVAKNIGATFNHNGEWGFQLDQSVPIQDIWSGLRGKGFSLFSGAHSGSNYEGKINGSWYHIVLNSIADGELVMEHHFEVSKPSSGAHKMDYLSGRASSWQRPSKEECDRRKKNSK